MGKILTGRSVLTASIQRMKDIYKSGNRVVVAFSGGKDSMVILEVAIIAARELGMLPVEVQFIDEEIVYPGTQEYTERTANRKEVKFHWVVLNHPNINVCNRENPYWFAYDPWLTQDKWMQVPPNGFEKMNEIDLYNMTNVHRFPPPVGKDIISIIGIRTAESSKRYMSLAGMQGGYITGHRGNPKPIVRVNPDGSVSGSCNAWPIYDWLIGDIWKATKELNWDYNIAYTTMTRMGVPLKMQRIAPVGFNESSIRLLQMMRGAWPDWLDKVCERLPGTRTAMKFGVRAVEPQRRLGESWERCFKRTCIETAPAWIAERSQKVMEGCLRRWEKYSNRPFPENSPPGGQTGGVGLITSWYRMAQIMYNGDPFSLYIRTMCKEVETNRFEPGRGTWADKGQMMSAMADEFDTKEDIRDEEEEDKIDATA